jgi:hypothetical protein
VIPPAALANFAQAWALTVLLEGLVLWFALAQHHSPRTRLFAAAWLSSCTLPLVHFGFPALRSWGVSNVTWVAVAEVFAPLAECALFVVVVAPATSGAAAHTATRRDLAAIVVANVVSFSAGLLILG